ncbi:MAG TPA: NADH-quinone oxidoreductase subunit C [Gaiella sp.]|nr:NADH-quinone oxidoreductase subunit C [Gaiella sp.]
MSLEAVPGVVERVEAQGETTLVVDPARVVEACTHLRDAEGYNVLVDLSGVDYLGWGTTDVAGYIGTAGGRDLNAEGSQGVQRTPAPKPKRFAVAYHLLRVSDDPARLRVVAWLDEGQEIDSVVGVWPAADWNEREAYDLFGIVFRGHPNLVRILMPDDWEGFPLRKDYPLGGEPVRFSGEA